MEKLEKIPTELLAEFEEASFSGVIHLALTNSRRCPMFKNVDRRGIQMCSTCRHSLPDQVYKPSKSTNM